MRRVDFSAVAALLLAHSACSAAPDGPSASIAASQDAELRRSAERILAQEPALSVSARNVAIKVRSHVVRLSGSVATNSEKELIEVALLALPTVARVSNALDVSPQRDRDDSESDRTMVEAIRESIASDPRLASTTPSLRIEARHGVVRFYGRAPDQDLERGIEGIAEETPGVVAVDNDIEIAR